jgi:hypothetical protein
MYVPPEEFGGIEVAQVVETHACQPDPRRQPSEPRGEQVRVDRPTVAAFHDQIRTLPVDAEEEAALELVGTEPT